MKPPFLALAAMALAFTGCATTSTPTPAPLFINVQGQRCMIVPVSMDRLQPHDVVIYRAPGDVFTFSTIGEQRGPNVFRLTADGFVLLTPTNYVGKAYPVKP